VAVGRVERTAEEIQALRIQGANAIAKEALRALAEDLAASPGADGVALAARLREARPNEPMLRNLLAAFLEGVRVQPQEADVRALAERLLDKVRRDEEALAAAGADLVQDGMTVFTHCHSSSAVSILQEAHRRGRRFRVLNTETRPRFQGRITASELSREGIEVTHMVDSAAKYALDGADLFLFGADAILPSGYLINKVGTGIFCVVASRYDVPTYCATLTLKVVRDRADERVEERPPEEVWPEAPPGVKVFNPAFDKVHLKYVTAFVTERGLVKDILAAFWDPREAFRI
jgi:ribose 1,5-bisphosphate isomerase